MGLRAAWSKARRAADELAFRLRPPEPLRIHVVSAAHDAGRFIDRHLSSLASQRYPRTSFSHELIDDASGDDTLAIARRFAERHTDHPLTITENRERLGGCANYTRAFRAAPPGSIVLQVDADDWLPDERVFAYVSRVYRDPEVWMTYNTWVYADGTRCGYCAEIGRDVIRDNDYRARPWISSHLHSFRAELFAHVRDESLRDPETGDFWRAAVDMSHYLPMLELAGAHARHLDRTMYVYNFHPESIARARRDEQVACEKRIRALDRYAPLGDLRAPK